MSDVTALSHTCLFCTCSVQAHDYSSVMSELLWTLPPPATRGCPKLLNIVYSDCNSYKILLFSLLHKKAFFSSTLKRFIFLSFIFHFLKNCNFCFRSLQFSGLGVRNLFKKTNKSSVRKFLKLKMLLFSFEFTFEAEIIREESLKIQIFLFVHM